MVRDLIILMRDSLHKSHKFANLQLTKKYVGKSPGVNG